MCVVVWERVEQLVKWAHLCAALGTLALAHTVSALLHCTVLPLLDLPHTRRVLLLLMCIKMENTGMRIRRLLLQWVEFLEQTNKLCRIPIFCCCCLRRLFVVSG